MQPTPDRDPFYPSGSLFRYWGETLTIDRHEWDAFANEYDCICTDGRGESCRVPESMILTVQPNPNRN